MPEIDFTHHVVGGKIMEEKKSVIEKIEPNNDATFK